MHLEIGCFFGSDWTNRFGRRFNDIFFLCTVSFTADTGKRVVISNIESIPASTIPHLISSRAARHPVSFRLFSSCPSFLHVKPITILHPVALPLTSTRLSPLFEEPRGLNSSLASPPHDSSTCVLYVLCLSFWLLYLLP